MMYDLAVKYTLLNIFKHFERIYTYERTHALSQNYSHITHLSQDKLVSIHSYL